MSFSIHQYYHLHPLNLWVFRRQLELESVNDIVKPMSEFGEGQLPAEVAAEAEKFNISRNVETDKAPPTPEELEAQQTEKSTETSEEESERKKQEAKERLIKELAGELFSLLKNLDDEDISSLYHEGTTKEGKPFEAGKFEFSPKLMKEMMKAFWENQDGEDAEEKFAKAMEAGLKLFENVMDILNKMAEKEARGEETSPEQEPVKLETDEVQPSIESEDAANNPTETENPNPQGGPGPASS